ncbi:MAG: hypothetical protein CL608_05610 [Anaerolineaceae bacterium]|nr:hypothetical protein [Anaerolineaceae bacterium]
MACADESTPLPTLQPTLAPLASPVPDTAIPATIEATGEAGSEAVPASSTPEADPALPEIDQAVCEEALKTQAELETLQEQGQDVSELATAVAELVGEMSQCASFYTPTPLP